MFYWNYTNHSKVLHNIFSYHLVSQVNIWGAKGHLCGRWSGLCLQHFKVIFSSFILESFPWGLMIVFLEQRTFHTFHVPNCPWCYKFVFVIGFLKMIKSFTGLFQDWQFLFIDNNSWDGTSPLLIKIQIYFTVWFVFTCLDQTCKVSFHHHFQAKLVKYICVCYTTKEFKTGK